MLLTFSCRGLCERLVVTGRVARREEILIEQVSLVDVEGMEQVATNRWCSSM